MIKRIISTVLFVLIALSIFSSFSLAVSANTLQLSETGGGRILGIDYEVQDYTLILSSRGQVTIKQQSLPYNSRGDIPNGYFESVIIKEDITAIEDGAFYKWAFLKHVEIGNTVTSIGNLAFADCYYDNGNTHTCLSEIIIPDSVVSIGDDAFKNCSGLTIYGYENSVAQEYANEHNINFVRFYGSCPNCGKNLHTDKGILATCTVDGLSEGAHCLYCGEVFVAQEVIPATGHKPVIDKAVKATCKHDGLTVGSHCDNCGLVYAVQQTIPKLPHTPVVDKGVDADCTHSGLSEGSHCEVCGDVIVPQAEIPALDHNYIATQGHLATHYHTGLSDGVQCTRCNHWLIEQTVIPKLEGILGDADGNGEIEIVDATFIQRYITQIDIPITEDVLMNGEIDADDMLTIMDVSLIQRYLSQLKVNYSIGE